VWPLRDGYWSHITYNDDAMIKVLELLGDVASGQNEFAFVPERTRKLASASVGRGIECLLETQIVAGGRRTVWCQQHDALTLQPTSARNYEMPSQSGLKAPNCDVLMRLPNPSSRIVDAVHVARRGSRKPNCAMSHSRRR
jgi:pectinesterase